MTGSEQRHLAVTAAVQHGGDILTADACLIVDEAFMDVSPAETVLAAEKLPDNAIVLRSFGKLFGLAGLLSDQHAEATARVTQAVAETTLAASSYSPGVYTAENSAANPGCRYSP